MKSGLAFNFTRFLSRFSADGSVELETQLPNLRSSAPYPGAWADVYFYSDGRALVSSDFTTVDGYRRDGLARLTREGVLDLSFHPGITPKEALTNISVGVDGKIYVAGAFDDYAGLHRPRLARVNLLASETVLAPLAQELIPEFASIKKGEHLVLKAVAVSAGPAVYRWYRGRAPEQGIASPLELVLLKVGAEPWLEIDSNQDPLLGPQDSTYFYTVENMGGVSVSPMVSFSLLPADPEVLSQTHLVAAQSGKDVFLRGSLNAGVGLFETEWRMNGNLVATQNNTIELFIPSIIPAQADTYTFTVRNLRGAFVSSAPIVVTVDQVSRFTNLSTRGWVGSGERAMIAGFVLRGDSRRALLLRGVGPGLARFGVSNVLADPHLTLFNARGAVVSTNDNWGTEISAAEMEETGAFWLSPGSKDAALRITSLDPGSYTVMLSGLPAGAIGEGMIEIYESDTLTDRMVNLSTRVMISGDVPIAIPGFAVRGTVSKTLLVRAIGPGLSIHGVTEPLADPRVTLMSEAGTVLASNDNWSVGTQTSALRNAFVSTGAFALDENSKDAALLITVPPGNYTAHVHGAVGMTGIVLVEVYEIP